MRPRAPTMKWFSDLSARAKLLCSFITLLSLTILVGVFSVQKLGTVAGIAEEFNEDWIPSVRLMGATRAGLRKFEVARLSHIIATTEEDLAKYDAELVQAANGINKDLSDYDRLIHNEEDRRHIAGVKESIAAFLSESETVIRLSRRNQKKEALEAALGSKVSYDQAVERINAQVKLTQGLAAARAREATETYHAARASIAAVIGFSVLLGLALSLGISRSFAASVERLLRVIADLGQGRLTSRVPVTSQDEFGKMGVALNQSLDAMCSTLGNVNEISLELGATAQQLSGAAQGISAGAQEQASSLEETAASLEEISSMVKQNSDNAQHAAELANEARAAAERGGHVVGSAVSAMAEITRSSKTIAEIIATIDEIAFQTNLLALNAAVEAVRAGDQGRGFGVVAAEIRTLSQRTASAAKEIRGLIADSSTKVEVGTQQVNQSGATLQEIVRSVKRMTDMVTDIAAASRDQNTGISQVNTAVNQVDQVTQSNAAHTEQLSSTAESLAEKAGHLQYLLSGFKFHAENEVDHGRTPPRREARRPVPERLPPLNPIERRVAPRKPVLNGHSSFEEF
jgi:methyl-accepting chemotaxis protein